MSKTCLWAVPPVLRGGEGNRPSEVSIHGDNRLGSGSLPDVQRTNGVMTTPVCMMGIEVRKQPPLTQEEVTILESYIEQWDSAEPSERKRVSKAAATEARTKAPVMSIRLLKDRKVAYEAWFRSQGTKRKPSKPPIKIGQKWTERSVVDTLRKKELLEKIQDETGAKPGTKEMINHYTKQLNQLIASLSPDELQEAKETAELWNRQGVPDDVKADIARKKGDDMIHHFATEMWNRAGMRVFIVSAWKNEEGKIHVADSFMKTHNWDTILPEWDSYAESAFDGNLDGDAVVTRKKGRQDKTYILQLGDDGYPVLPACDSVDLDTKKAVIRAFLTWHYRKCCGDPKIAVPWKYVIPRYTEIIPAECLPEGHSLAEPSKLKQVHATQLLQFWYNRQEDGEAHVLEFIGWWDNDKEDMVLAADIDVPVRKPTATTRQPKQRSQSRNRNGSNLNSSLPKKYQRRVQLPRKRRVPKQLKERELACRIVHGRVEDLSHLPMKSTTNRSPLLSLLTDWTTPRMRFRHARYSKYPAQEDEESGRTPAECCPQAWQDRRRLEPSATAAELTASAPGVQVKRPAQVVNTADNIPAKTRVHKRTAEESLERSPTKRTRRQVAMEQDKGIARQAGKMAGKKQVTEQATDGSPSKRTRSKTSQTGAGKRARKPNSRYNDYVKP
ncbi:hypothetical protein C8R48DRAFT_680371 [Suillus tomentosus]|nr:hypothetical protein C8R48DRAFT_680371 [Suillus tomentosus]